MCFFITIAVHEKNADSFEDAIPRGLVVYRVAQKTILRELPDGYRTYLLTSGMCSCDLYRPGSRPLDRSAQFSRIRARYEKMGWSKTKIDRAIAQRAKKPVPKEFVGLRVDVARLLADIVGESGELAVLVHFYSGDVVSEPVEVRSRGRISATQLVEKEYPLAEESMLWISK